jgi:hypothetical protein
MIKKKLGMPSIWVIIWIAGAVIAKGFWSTIFAIFTFGFYSFYLVIERCFQYLGWI